MYILSCYVALLSFKLLYIVKGSSGDMHCKLAKAINVVVFIWYVTLVPVQINNKERQIKMRTVLEMQNELRNL